MIALCRQVSVPYLGSKSQQKFETKWQIICECGREYPILFRNKRKSTEYFLNTFCARKCYGCHARLFDGAMKDVILVLDDYDHRGMNISDLWAIIKSEKHDGTQERPV